MAYATFSVWATEPVVDQPIEDGDTFRIKVGGAGITLHADEAVTVRDALSAEIIKAAHRRAALASAAVKGSTRLAQEVQP